MASYDNEIHVLLFKVRQSLVCNELATVPQAPYLFTRSFSHPQYYIHFPEFGEKTLKGQRF